MIQGKEYLFVIFFIPSLCTCMRCKKGSPSMKWQSSSKVSSTSYLPSLVHFLVSFFKRCFYQRHSKKGEIMGFKIVHIVISSVLQENGHFKDRF